MIYLMWLAVLILLTLVFSHLTDKARLSRMDVRTDEAGHESLILSGARDGHYRASGEINGQSVEFLLDTGASDVSIPADIAEDLHLKGGAPFQAHTANGTVTVYATRLDEVSVGPLSLRNVRASINPNMEGESVLLGMSFLKRLDLEQKNGNLTLRYAGQAR